MQRMLNKLRLLFFLFMACSFCSLRAQTEERINTNYLIGLSKSSITTEKLNKDVAETTLRELLPFNFTLTENNGLLTITTENEINPVDLESSLKNKGMVLSSFVKQQHNAEGKLLFVLYYKPSSRDPWRSKQ